MLLLINRYYIFTHALGEGNTRVVCILHVYTLYTIFDVEAVPPLPRFKAMH
jgi:hypothetical protein